MCAISMVRVFNDNLKDSFKILSKEELKKLPFEERQEYRERRLVLKDDWVQGKRFCRNIYFDEPNIWDSYDLLQKCGKDYELHEIKVERWRAQSGVNVKIAYYRIGETQQVWVDRIDCGGIYEDIHYCHFTSIEKMRRDAQAEREKKSFKLPINPCYNFSSYSFKNPKEWDELFDTLMPKVTGPSILYFQSGQHLFCATMFHTTGSCGNKKEWFSVSVFTHKNPTDARESGYPLLFSRYGGQNHHIAGIYKEEAHSIPCEEFASRLGVTTEEASTWQNLFPSWLCV